MKLLYLITCIIGLTGCQKEITDKNLATAKFNHTRHAAASYLDQYNQKGTNTKVFHDFSLNDKYFSIHSIVEDTSYQCSDTLNIRKEDIEEATVGRDVTYYLKNDVFVDYRPFYKCINERLSDIPLSFDNLQVFSNDPSIKKYKESDSLVSGLVKRAKADGQISYMEALDIYEAVYKQTERDLFKQL